MDIDEKSYSLFSAWLSSSPIGKQYWEKEAHLFMQKFSENGKAPVLFAGGEDLNFLKTNIAFQPFHLVSLNKFDKKLVYPSRAFNCIIFPHIFEFVSEPWPILEEVKRLLLPRGLFLISGFSPYGYPRLLGKMGRDLYSGLTYVKPHSKHYITYHLSRSGFSFIEKTNFGVGTYIIQATVLETEMLSILNEAKWACPSSPSTCTATRNISHSRYEIR